MKIGDEEISVKQEPCEDCISRQAILGIIHFEDNWLYDAQSHNANTVIAFSGLKSKVKALPSVNPQEQEPILDKIRAEIEQVKSIMNDEIINHDRKDLINFVNGLNQSLVIIDKYKAESEVQDDL